MFKGVTSCGLRSGKDAILIPKPFVNYKVMQEMVKTINEKLGNKDDLKMVLNVFDGISSPSKIESTITQRINVYAYTATEITVAETLRALGVNSFIISQSRFLSTRSENLAKEIGEFIESVTAEDLIKALDEIERTHFLQTQLVEQEYQAAEVFVKSLREKYCARLLKDSPPKLTIVMY